MPVFGGGRAELPANSRKKTSASIACAVSTRNCTRGLSARKADKSPPPSCFAKWRYVPRGTLYLLYCTYYYIQTISASETTETGCEARESYSAAGFRGRAKASGGTNAGVAGVLTADQESSDDAARIRRSGMVPKAGGRVTEEN